MNKLAVVPRTHTCGDRSPHCNIAPKCTLRIVCKARPARAAAAGGARRDIPWGGVPRVPARGAGPRPPWLSIEANENVVKLCERRLPSPPLSSLTPTSFRAQPPLMAAGATPRLPQPGCPHLHTEIEETRSQYRLPGPLARAAFQGRFQGLPPSPLRRPTPLAAAGPDLGSRRRRPASPLAATPSLSLHATLQPALHLSWRSADGQQVVAEDRVSRPYAFSCRRYRTLSAPYPHAIRTLFAPRPHPIRTPSAPHLRSIRTLSAPYPHSIRTLSAPHPHSIRTPSAPYKHPIRTIQAPHPHQ